MAAAAGRPGDSAAAGPGTAAVPLPARETATFAALSTRAS
jgi:hypothetical protein